MGTTKILVVEDESIIALELENCLISMGYEVLDRVDTGDKAIKAVEVQEPDLILMDIRLKGDIDGIETAELIKQRSNSSIIFLTSYLDEERLNRTKIALPYGYLLKPVTEKELKLTIEMALYVAKIDAQRRETEQKLARSEAKYRAIVENATEAIIIVDKNGHFLFMNASAAKQLDGVPDDFITKTIWEVFSEKTAKDRFELLQDVIKSNRTTTFELNLLFREGSRSYDTTVMPIEFDETRAVMAIMSDITDRKSAEKELQLSEQRYRYFYHNTHIALFSIGVSDGRPHNCNRLFAELMGYDDLQSCLDHYVAPEHYVDPKERETLLVELREHGFVNNFLVHGLKRDGTAFWASISAVYNEEADILEGAIIDISDRINVEKAMASYQQQLELEVENRTAELVRAKIAAEDANKTKSEFLGNISHELRTPLHHIFNYSKFGMNQQSPIHSDTIDYFQRINQSCLRMLDHVEELINLSQLEARQVTYDFKQYPISFTLNNVRSDLESRMAARGLSISIPQTRTMLRFDFTKIRQVLALVIMNAIQYADANSEIKLTFDETDETFTIAVHNRGAEIPREELESIFDPFVQSSSTKSGAGGKGLGLSICKRIMEDHSGNIWAEETQNGATIKLCFSKQLPASIH